MLYYVFLRILFSVYFSGIALVMLKAIADFLMSSETFKSKILRFLDRALFAPIWPLYIFNVKGRQKLFNNLPFNL